MKNYTGMSNLASQRVAARAGFEIAWVELLSEKDESNNFILDRNKAAHISESLC